MENATLLTNAAAAIEWAREEERLEELEVTIHQARLEALREVRARLEGKPRVRRSRPRSTIIEMPDRVGGGLAVAETEPPDLVA
jgi:hypothetical protein